jgi:hypothetical protein
VGLFLGTLLAYPIGIIIFIVSLFGMSFGVAHIIGHWYRKRITERARQKAEEDEKERRALAARAANAREGAAMSNAQRRRRRTRGGAAGNQPDTVSDD